MLTISLEFFQNIPDRDPDTWMRIIEIDWTHMEIEYKFFGVPCDVDNLFRPEIPRSYSMKKVQ